MTGHTHDLVPVVMTEPQTAPRCQLCGRALNRAEQATCRGCIDRTRTVVHQVYDGLALLPEETTERGGTSFDPIPKGAHDLPIAGGEAMVMLTYGGDGRHQTHDISTGKLRIGEAEPAPHAADEWASDPQSIPYLLTQWEDDWRLTRGDPAAQGFTNEAAGKAHAYLLENLEWAAREHPAFDEFREDMRRAAARLAAVTRTSAPRTKPRAHCLAEGCAGLLQQDWDEPRGCHHRQPCSECDHGGRRDSWECQDCGRTYTEAQHRVAIMEEVAARRALQVEKLEAAS